MPDLPDDAEGTPGRQKPQAEAAVNELMAPDDTTNEQRAAA